MIPEYQADYDPQGQLQGFRRLGHFEYTMPGSDGYGAMFAPVCGVKGVRFGQPVYKTLPEAIDAARRKYEPPAN